MITENKMKLKYTLLPLILFSSMSFANQLTGNVSQQLQEFNHAEDISELYKNGLVLPNQPLALSDEQRKQIRKLVQGQVDAYAQSGMNLKSYERDTLNAILFNYGLQVLDDNEVVMLDVFTSDVPTKPMLTPNMPMPEGSTVITADNIRSIKESIQSGNSTVQNSQYSNNSRYKQIEDNAVASIIGNDNEYVIDQNKALLDSQYEEPRAQIEIRNQ